MTGREFRALRESLPSPNRRGKSMSRKDLAELMERSVKTIQRLEESERVPREWQLAIAALAAAAENGKGSP